jgi:anti-sigma factor RsiW
MRDHDSELKLQALLDGELSAAESESVRALISRDAEARVLYDELVVVKTLLAGNESQVKVPESREFYWSGIARAIEREEPKHRMDVPVPSSAHSWFRLLLPAGAVAILALSLTIGWNLPGFGKIRVPALAGSHDIETPLEGAPTFTFRSEPEAMTVVWVDSGPN